jgi:DNA primase
LPEWRTLTRTGRKYLRDRGILKPEKFGIVELVDGGRIVIPDFGELGRLIYWVTRAFVPDGQPKYLGAPGRKPPYVLPDWSRHDEVVFVEGPLDCIVHHLATGLPTIALGGKAIAPYLRNTIDGLAGRKRSLMLDPEELSASLSLGQELEAQVVRLPAGLDPAEYYREQALEVQDE